jgi:hypothetical protein
MGCGAAASATPASTCSTPDRCDPITRLPPWNITLTAHAGFRTLEASMTLLRRAIDIVSGIVLAVRGSR